MSHQQGIYLLRIFASCSVVVTHTHNFYSRTGISKAESIGRSNSIIDKNTRAKTGLHSLGTLVSLPWYESMLIVISSYVSGEDIRSVGIWTVMHGMTIQPKEIPAEDLESLYEYLCRATPVFGPIHSGKNYIVWHQSWSTLVGGLFNGRMRILVEERIPGKNIHTTSLWFR